MFRGYQLNTLHWVGICCVCYMPCARGRVLPVNGSQRISAGRPRHTLQSCPRAQPAAVPLGPAPTRAAAVTELSQYQQFLVVAERVAPVRKFLDATSRARIKVATSARWRGLRISQQLMHSGELRRLVVLLHAREQAPRRQDVQGLFAAAACVEINQTQVARLEFDFHTGRRTGSSAGTRATRGRGASTSTRSSPTRRSGRR